MSHQQLLPCFIPWEFIKGLPQCAMCMKNQPNKFILVDDLGWNNASWHNPQVRKTHDTGFYNMPPPDKMTPDRVQSDIVPPDIVPPRHYATQTLCHPDITPPRRYSTLTLRHPKQKRHYANPTLRHLRHYATPTLRHPDITPPQTLRHPDITLP